MIAIAESDYLRSLHACVALAVPRCVVRSVRDLSAMLEQAEIDTAICDPSGGPDQQVLALVEKAARLRKRVYFIAEPTLRVTEVTLHAANRGLTGASFCGCALDCRRMRFQLRSSQRDAALPVRLLAAVSDALWRLPPRLRGELVICTMTVCRSNVLIGGLAQRVGGSTRSIARWVAEAGLVEPRKLCAALQIAHLWPELWVPEVPMSELARRAGYASERTMRAHCQRMLGWCPRHMRRLLTESDVTEALARAVRRRPH